MDLTNLPSDLPIPVDDGGCQHLLGKHLPHIELQATAGELVKFSEIKSLLVLYFYPMTGRPDVALPDGWDAIPGARGCTPQACSFRDSYSELQALGASIYGVSTQDYDYLQEVVDRLHLPFKLVSDKHYELADLLSLPTFEVAGMRLFKRCTIIIKNGVIIKVFYPVFPPNENASDVISWIASSKVL